MNVPFCFFISLVLLSLPRFSIAKTFEKSLDIQVRYLENIPENDVNCIFEDSKGFMWIGTLDGLHRYDGYSYKTYRIDNSGISSNMIIAVDEDSKGNIWIGTYGKGICKLNPYTDVFTTYADTEDHITKDVSAMLVDSADYIWIGNWIGITRIKMDEYMEQVEQVQLLAFPAEQSETEKAVKTIFQDKKGSIWLGTNLYTYRLKAPYEKLNMDNFERFPCKGEGISDFESGVLIVGENVQAVVEKNQGYELLPISDLEGIKILYRHDVIWLGRRDGISCLVQTNGEWKRMKHLSHDFSEEELSSNVITWLSTDVIGQIWAGTRGGGVNIISTRPKRFEHYKQTLNEGSLANNLTRCIFEDSGQNLWIGTEEAGVSFLKKDGNYRNGFRHIDVNNAEFENRVYAIEEMPTPASNEHESLIWLGSSYPVNLFAVNPRTLQIKDFGQSPANLGFIFCLEAENDSTLWAGSYNNGLWRLTLNSKGEIIHSQNFTPETASPTLSFIIRSVFKDSKGNLWIGTDKGLNRISASEIHKEHPKIEKFTVGTDRKHLNHDYILQVIEAKDGTIWIGTMGGGLIRYDENSGDYSFTAITTEDGLPNNSIKTIVEDENGCLWLASNKGISKYNPKDNSITDFDKEDGLQENEFSEICGIKRRSGELVFGGINGFNTFLAKEFDVIKTKPKLYFTDFLILNKEVFYGDTIDEQVILKQTIEYTEELELEYKHNSFSIGFAGVHYDAPQKHKYRYILEGFDREWYNASPRHRVAKYTNIPDGKYVFMVMGSNSDNVWSTQPIELKITIKPPLYRSAQAYFLYVLLLMLLAYIIYRVIKMVAKRKQELLLANIEKNKAEEISKAKLQFFTNISHEFRTPLSLIAAPLEQLLSQGHEMPDEKRAYHLGVIKRNTGLMMRLITQLLDFRKLDQNKLRLKPSRQNINEFLENIFNAFDFLGKQKNINYQFVPTARSTDIWIDAEKMEKVIYNLLSNAFKFTPDNGQITLKADVNLDKKRYIISVSDSGEGIEPEEAEHIFERYYQSGSKSKKNTGGTGIGLALSKGIVDLHYGEIGFYPNPAGGTVFFVKLKTGFEHFTTESVIETQPGQAVFVPENNIVKNEEPLDSEEKKQNHLPSLLIVEDNYELRKQLKDIFSLTYRIIEAEDGLAGSRLCKEKMPDLIISDVMMPNMDGIEMCKQLKEDEATSHIPILLLTAKNTEEARIDGYHTGADGYLAKPFNIEVLKARVKSLVDNREKMRLRFQKEIEINPNIISNTPADARFLDKILAKIEENLSDSEYSVEQLAKDYGVSRIYLNRKIKALTGETTNQFMRNIRLKHAAELLKQNKLNISEVTWDVGYNDLRTFRQRFKEKFGVSPSEYARQFKKEE